MKIRKLKAKIIPDALGSETIEITINNKYKGSAPLPISPGSREVLPFPPQGIPISLVNVTLSRALKGFRFNDLNDLKLIEQILFDFDSTPKLEKLGGNVVIALENALLRGGAGNQSVWQFLNPYANEMPIPMGECLGGGKHFKGESTDMQEFLLIPHTEKFYDAIYLNHYIYKQVEHHLTPNGKTCNGSWITNLDTSAILDLLKKIANEVFDRFDVQIGLGIDVAATHLYSGGYYFYKKGKLDRLSQIKYINILISRYGLEYVEDPLEENDINGYTKIKYGDIICGDDLICSQLERLKETAGKINAVIIIPSQIGSLLKTKEIIDYAKQNAITPILSHRGGETMDTMISELAVAWNLPFIKCGISGKERLIKINRLKEIEKEIK